MTQTQDSSKSKATALLGRALHHASEREGSRSLMAEEQASNRQEAA
jgi:hypothetical protein